METDQESRLRLFLEEYERLCKKYSLYIDVRYTIVGERVYERINESGEDCLPEHMAFLKKGGINP